VNVLYLHQHFATREGSGGTRSYEFAQYLLSQGHRVTMVVAQRHGGGIGEERVQQVDGIDIISMGGFYSNHLSVRARVREFLRFTWRASRLRASELPYAPDVVIATSTPLTIGIPGRFQSRRLKAPFVFEVRDLWPQAPIEMGALTNPVAKWLARRLERWCYRHADEIIALSPGMTAGVIATGVDAGKVTTIPNASDLELFNPALRDRAVTVAPSVGSWLRATSTPKPRHDKVALVAGPGLETDGAEVHDVAARYPGANLLTGEAATA